MIRYSKFKAIDKITQWFFLRINQGPTRIPRRLKFVQSLKIIKPLVSKKWLDLGAGDGTYLNFMSNESVGLDIHPNPQKKIFSWNFNDSCPKELLGKIDVIWCSNLIEHVLRPHEFLLRIKEFLTPNGIVILCCPQTLLRNSFIFRGTLHGDHVNFFNLTTLKLTMRFAGYRIIFAGSPSSKRWGQKFSFVSPIIMVIAVPLPNFQYPESAHKYLDSNGLIVFKDENIGH